MVENLSYIGLRLDLLSEIEGNENIILDVGCATGTNGKYLIEKNKAQLIYGIEIDEAMASKAKAYYTDVLVTDLNNRDSIDNFSIASFDYILAGDVLEHLDEPLIVLKKLTRLLKKGGKIIISLPNIQHIDVFIHLFIKGTWPQNSRGIFDRTHKRFFTINDISNLISNAGLKIYKIKRNFRYRDAVGSKFPFYGYLLKRFFSRYYTFQYIAVCSNE